MKFVVSTVTTTILSTCSIVKNCRTVTKIEEAIGRCTTAIATAQSVSRILCQQTILNIQCGGMTNINSAASPYSSSLHFIVRNIYGGILLLNRTLTTGITINPASLMTCSII